MDVMNRAIFFLVLIIQLVLLLSAGCSADTEMDYRDGIYRGRVHTQQEVPHGEGTWISPEGKKYVGYWSEGEIVEGKLFVDEDVLYYEGEFAGGEKHGEGTLYWEDGTVRYEGGWRQGKMHGQGTLYWEDGTVRYQGEWRDGGF